MPRALREGLLYRPYGASSFLLSRPRAYALGYDLTSLRDFVVRRFAVVFLILCFSVLSLTGCIVQSFHPFYTDASKINPPQLAGEWDFIKSGSDDLSKKTIKPWVFSEAKAHYEVVCYNKDNIYGKLKAVFFKVGDLTFCDFFAGDLSDHVGVNEFWILNVRPVHTVARAEIKGDLLTFKSLDYEWTVKGLEKKELTLPVLKPANPNDELPLFTATPQEWEKFLKLYGSSTNAFPDKSASVLKKRKINDKDEAKDGRAK